MAPNEEHWSDEGQVSDEVNPRRWWILLVLCLSLFMVVMGNTVVNIALPRMSEALGASGSQLQWVVDAYSLVFAGLLFTAGSLGDRFGRKGALQTGLVIFGTGSAMATFATSVTWVIACRAVMGLGAALVMPATLSILTHVFPPHERAKAIGVWAGVAGAAGAIGPVTSGWLLQHFYWGSVFWLNVPVVLTALVSGFFLVPTSRHPDRVPLDPLGALISVGMIGSLIYGFIEAPVYGWTSSRSLVAFAVAAVLLVVFLVWELRAEHPMLDIRFFSRRGFSGGSLAIALMILGIYGMFFILTLYLQLVRGYSALEAGLRTLPFAVTMMIVAPNSANVAARIGVRATVAIGMTTAGVGLLLLGHTSTLSSSYGLLALSLVVLATGMGLTMPPSTASIMASLPQQKAGVGSAMNDTMRETGGSLGIAILGSILATSYRSSLGPVLAGVPANVADTMRSGLGQALQVAPSLGADAQRVIVGARSAFLDGMSLALTVGAAVAIGGAVLVWFLQPKPERSAADAPAPGPAEPAPAGSAP